MTKRILVNALHPEEIRIATVEDNQLIDICIQMNTKEHLKGNIYKGKIVSVEPGLQAAFVEYANRRHGFLPFKEISPENYSRECNKDLRRVRIQDVMTKDQEVLIQVEREERDTKGASLTTYISIPGRYIVMMPGEKKKLGVSRKIEEPARRDEMREIFDSLKPPKSISFILRTAGIDRTKSDFESDLKYLLKLWDYIQEQKEKVTAPALVYKEQDFPMRYIRDYLTPDTGEVLIDNREEYKGVKEFLRKISPSQQKLIKLYRRREPIFVSFSIEEQIEHIHKRQVPLPSGGYFMIDRTEALTSIDINSGRSRGEKNIEATAYKTNLEAADEIARQLRLRDIGGLIVIDFIDMSVEKHRRNVQKRLKEAVKLDKAHTEFTRISVFGLLEMSRERLRQTFSDSVNDKCPYCGGKGTIKLTLATAMMALRKIENLVYKTGVSKITCTVPVESANYLLNHKRGIILSMEKYQGSKIAIIGTTEKLPEDIVIEVEKEGDIKVQTESEDSIQSNKKKQSAKRMRPRRTKSVALKQKEKTDPEKSREEKAEDIVESPEELPA